MGRDLPIFDKRTDPGRWHPHAVTFSDIISDNIICVDGVLTCQGHMKYSKTYRAILEQGPLLKLDSLL